VEHEERADWESRKSKEASNAVLKARRDALHTLFTALDLQGTGQIDPSKVRGLTEVRLTCKPGTSWRPEKVRRALEKLCAEESLLGAGVFVSQMDASMPEVRDEPHNIHCSEAARQLSLNLFVGC